MTYHCTHRPRNRLGEHCNTLRCMETRLMVLVEDLHWEMPYSPLQYRRHQEFTLLCPISLTGSRRQSTKIQIKLCTSTSSASFLCILHNTCRLIQATNVTVLFHGVVFSTKHSNWVLSPLMFFYKSIHIYSFRWEANIGWLSIEIWLPSK